MGSKVLNCAFNKVAKITATIKAKFLNSLLEFPISKQTLEKAQIFYTKQHNKVYLKSGKHFFFACNLNSCGRHGLHNFYNHHLSKHEYTQRANNLMLTLSSQPN